jgi:hypothetical protein
MYLNFFPRIYIPVAIFYIKADYIFENFMNWYGYFFNLAGYPASQPVSGRGTGCQKRPDYPAGYPVHP